MSSYGKDQDQYVYDAAATRPNQAPSYPGLAQPSFTSQYTDAPARLSHEPTTVEMPYISTSSYESRGASSYQAESPFIDARSRHPAPQSTNELEVTNVVHPSQGTAGSSVLLHLRTTYDLAKEQYKFTVMFTAKRCTGELQKLDHEDGYFNYALSFDVPPFPSTNSWNPTMTLKLLVEDKNDLVIHEKEAGKFTFTDMSPTLTYQSVAATSPELGRKRKFSVAEFGEPQDYSEGAKRANTMRLQAKPRSLSGAYPSSSVSPLPGQAALTGTYGYSNAYDLNKPATYTPQLPQKSLYAVPSGISMPQNDMKPPAMSPGLSHYSAYSSIGPIRRSPASIPAPQTPSRAPMMSSPSLPTPTLVRATTLPQPGGGPMGQSGFNPYLMPSKAKLEIDGDLDKMSTDWTQEEFDAKRRLVQFERSQVGSTITATFAPVTPEERPARSICVSCILWEEKEECFITSVDTIYLLEQLVNVRFTVEEKNRIRRNLEGFRPLTVSKAKPESEEFFKVIMGFPNPKPRNIEKDVKVFPWKILNHALKKIISKYTASYSSTAGAGSLPGAGASAYVPVGISQTGDGHRHASPRSVASSAATNAYTPSMTTSVSPNLRGSAGLDGSAAHGIPVPQRDPTGQTMSQWGAGAAPHHPVTQYTTGMPTGGRGGSWDYGNYIDTSGATQPMHDNPYQPYGTSRV
ncbi:hypothetical protein BU24DRAFT_356325 [Aaosphaeria arxii CBS 175.79]|uniref:DUF7082 domain-containing protein n=1 Tax=Aaosphaeria arxii CBS 175.79 TaxID=1450172 RepID=A0A6A5XBY5_9PLEO|nr:uncharacterized protein BU24DRAFT_356325 [Aaosphaeria arxii CBS 175.79]KAF2010411.1 hypothetical protein BU24DRAFT_356325 [Aaosphaeria arxii CBS 175.79]